MDFLVWKPGCRCCFPMGVSNGRLSLRDFVRVTAERPAELYGLRGRKGVLAPGADADMVICDEAKRVRISTETLHDELDYTPYEGMVVEGRPQTTISRGEIPCHDGRLLAQPDCSRLIACDRPNAARTSGKPVTGYDVTQNRLIMR
ncbi:amidohydrolase family protein [Rhizobium sp. BK418]|nr:amidohydrolase family protein [Rhizobium sp. BK418]